MSKLLFDKYPTVTEAQAKKLGYVTVTDNYDPYRERDLLERAIEQLRGVKIALVRAPGDFIQIARLKSETNVIKEGGSRYL